MNIERIKELRDFVASSPEDKFNYANYFSNVHTGECITTGGIDKLPENTCNTAACLAGWTCILWREEAIEKRGYFSRIAGSILGLTSLETELLFMVHCLDANRQDALRRLDWIISGKPLIDYFYDHETEYIPSRQQSPEEFLKEVCDCFVEAEGYLA